MSTSSKQKNRKARIGFNVTKDILLLQLAVNNNPWQNGDDQWNEIAKEMRAHLQETFLGRTVRSRVNLLVQKYKTNQLKYKSGCEVEMTNRGTLIEEVISIQEEEKSARAAASVVNIEHTADNSEQVEVLGDITEVEVQYVNLEQEGENEDGVPPPRMSSTKQRRAERNEADCERQRYVDEAIGMSSSKGKRPRLTVEEELIQKRHEHDIEMDKKATETKLEIEKQKTTHEIELEKSKLELEKKKTDAKLELEKGKQEIEVAREIRKEEEARRRDEIARIQMEVQSKMLQVLEKYCQK